MSESTKSGHSSSTSIKHKRRLKFHKKTKAASPTSTPGSLPPHLTSTSPVRNGSNGDVYRGKFGDLKSSGANMSLGRLQLGSTAPEDSDQLLDRRMALLALLAVISKGGNASPGSQAPAGGGAERKGMGMGGGAVGLFGLLSSSPSVETQADDSPPIPASSPRERMQSRFRSPSLSTASSSSMSSSSSSLVLGGPILNPSGGHSGSSTPTYSLSAYADRSTVPLSVDPRGVARGKCLQCDRCQAYRRVASPFPFSCADCNCPPTKHLRVSSSEQPASSPSSSSLSDSGTVMAAADLSLHRGLSPLPGDPDDSWNSRFQNTLKNLGDLSQAAGPLEHRIAVNTELLHLSQDFVQFVKRYGKIIISEQYLAEKSVMPHMIDGDTVYYVQGVRFSFGFAHQNLAKTDEIAHKICANELLAMSAYFGTRLTDISVPLMALVDYMGFRVIATSVLPISSQPLLYGSSDGGQTVVNSDPDFSAQIAAASAKLNLKPHLVGTGTHCTELHTCGDVEGYKGSDDRYYLINLARSFPPDTSRLVDSGSHLYRLLRPEFVASWPFPLCSDAYSTFILNDPQRIMHNKEVEQATSHLFTKVIPDYARKLNWALREAIDLGALDSFGLTENLHRHGINLRYIGLLEKSMSDESSRRLLYIEAVARVIKNRLRLLLRTKMRQLKLPLEVPYRQTVIDYFNLVFSQENEYWTQVLPAQLKAHFSFDSEWPFSNGQSLHRVCFAPFPEKDRTRANPNGRLLVFSRVESLMGFTFSSFARKKMSATYSQISNLAFDLLDLESIGDRVKHPSIVMLAEALYFYYRGQFKANLHQARYYLMRANEYFADALQSDPRNPTILYMSSQSQHQYLELHVSITQNVPLSEVIFQSNREGMLNPDVAKTDTLYLRAIDANPTNASILSFYGSFLAKCGRITRADDFFLRSLELNPCQPKVLVEYASFLEKMHLDELSAQFNKYALELKDAAPPSLTQEISDPKFDQSSQPIRSPR